MPLWEMSRMALAPIYILHRLALNTDAEVNASVIERDLVGPWRGFLIPDGEVQLIIKQLKPVP